jgi:hypothetical protein
MPSAVVANGWSIATSRPGVWLSHEAPCRTLPAPRPNPGGGGACQPRPVPVAGRPDGARAVRPGGANGERTPGGRGGMRELTPKRAPGPVGPSAGAPNSFIKPLGERRVPPLSRPGARPPAGTGGMFDSLDNTSGASGNAGGARNTDGATPPATGSAGSAPNTPGGTTAPRAAGGSVEMRSGTRGIGGPGERADRWAGTAGMAGTVR